MTHKLHRHKNDTKLSEIYTKFTREKDSQITQTKREIYAKFTWKRREKDAQGSQKSNRTHKWRKNDAKTKQKTQMTQT